MAFLDEGTPRYETYKQGTANSASERWLLVKGSKAIGAKYPTADLTTAASDNFDGVLDNAEAGNVTDPFDTSFTGGICRVKTGEKLRVRTATAYAASNYNQRIVPDATNNGYGSASASNGKGRIVGGETIGTKHYLDFWLDESDQS